MPNSQLPSRGVREIGVKGEPTINTAPNSSRFSRLARLLGVGSCPPPLVASGSGDKLRRGLAVARSVRARAEAGGLGLSQGPRILLVDDEIAIQRAVGPLLRSRGYDVDIAGTGAQALEMFAVRGPWPGRPRPGPAGSRRDRSVPAHSRDVCGANHRAVGTRRGG